MKNFNFLFFCKTPGYRHEQWIPADSFHEAREVLARNGAKSVGVPVENWFFVRKVEA